MGKNQNKQGGMNITLLVQDETWRKLGNFRWNTADYKKQKYILKTIEDAFGISFVTKTDIDWLK